MLLLWDIALMPEPLTSRYFQTEKQPAGDQFPQHLWLFSPEQSNWVSALARYFPEMKKPLHKVDDRPEICRNSDLSIVNNFVVLDQMQFMVYSQKLQLQQHRFEKDDYWHLMRFSDWQNLYKEFCAPQYRPVGTQNDWLRLSRDVWALDPEKWVWQEFEDGGYKLGKKDWWKDLRLADVMEEARFFVAGHLNFLNQRWLSQKRLKEPVLDSTPRTPVELAGIGRAEVLAKVRAALEACPFFDAPEQGDALKRQLQERWSTVRARIEEFEKPVHKGLGQIRDILLQSGLYAEVVQGSSGGSLALMPSLRPSLIIYRGSLKTIVRIAPADPVVVVTRKGKKAAPVATLPAVPLTDPEEPRSTLQLTISYDEEKDCLMAQGQVDHALPFFSRELLSGRPADVTEAVLVECEKIFQSELIPRLSPTEKGRLSSLT